MRHPNDHNSPATRDRADAHLRRLTRTVVLAAAGATAFVAVVVAREHPGVSASAPGTGSPVTNPVSSPTVGTGATPSTSNSSPTNSDPVTEFPGTPSPSPTSAPPVVTSGGTSR